MTLMNAEETLRERVDRATALLGRCVNEANRKTIRFNAADRGRD